MSGIPENISQLMSKCIGCGSCDDVCPSFSLNGCSPSKNMQGEDGNILSCIGCGKCSFECEETDPFKVMLYM